jgi:hypothetical protein
VIIPWTFAWLYLSNHAVLPYVQRHIYCAATHADPEAWVFGLYASFAMLLGGVVAFVFSLPLGRLLRPKWLLPWVTFCAATALGVLVAARSHFLGQLGAMFMLPNSALYTYAVTSLGGFLFWRFWRLPLKFRLTNVWSGRET